MTLADLSAQDIARLTLEAEEMLLERLNVKRTLTRILSLPGGCARFASAFYFVRYNFFKLNFLVGSRSSAHELYWSPLVNNLYEELGGPYGTSHNELYRQFLNEVGIRSESDLVQPSFAVIFNHAWEDYAITAPFDEALAAIGIYEILDRPDYRLLLEVVRSAGLSDRALRFFEVHASAEHFDMFTDTMKAILRHRSGQECVSRAVSFVQSVQQQMWTGLLQHLEDTATSD